MFYLIYKITNRINNKIYVGSHKTKNIDDGYMGSGKYLNRAYQKYGVENFSKEILFIFDNAKERSAKISQSLKGRRKTEEHKEAYKRSRLASGGWVVSDEQKRKVSEKLSGQGNPMWGKTHNEESRRIISEANKQTVLCPHCGKTGGIAIMKRWHFNNCKALT